MKKTIILISIILIISACAPISIDNLNLFQDSSFSTFRDEVLNPTPTPIASYSQPDVSRVDLPENVLDIIANDYPRIDGSTSTFPLQMMVACTIHGVDCEWYESSPFSPFDLTTKGIFPTEQEMLSSPDVVEKFFSITHNGTHGSYVNLINGDADIILVARQPSEDELREAARENVILDVRPVALDAFVFLVHVENPVDDLRIDTIREIYTGDIKQWGDVVLTPFEDDTIQPYQRNANSGSQELMEKLVMQGEKMVHAPDMILEGMIGPFNAISSDPKGIGYSVYFYAVHIFTSDKVKVIGVDGVQPTAETISSRAYSLTTEVYVVLRGDMDPGSTAVMLRDWLLTNQGQTTVAESGYVPVGKQTTRFN